MIYTPMINKALRIMFTAHRDQCDKNGVPYVFHPFHVAEQMKDEDTVTAALLHDTVEDAGLTPGYLREQGFNERVVNAVAVLSHDDGEDYFDYVRRVRQDPVARVVKLADLEHNSDLSRIEEPAAEDFRRAEKYRKAIAILKGEEDLRYADLDLR
ncbi:MAG: bifunctional (p)ppGpp synthetase/guanosine-3',5'-bis(diphosphate) 3'-pyrophosphohydrolase [Ruminococcus sp.]|nr:bifunctional (p)ppGpp synthetase/guanosine-3',5'-bis(diphosphate) 3'-pyrophosphohydrolase [Ruminococcus sp.]